MTAKGSDTCTSHIYINSMQGNYIIIHWFLLYISTLNKLAMLNVHAEEADFSRVKNSIDSDSKIVLWGFIFCFVSKITPLNNYKIEILQFLSISEILKIIIFTGMYIFCSYSMTLYEILLFYTFFLYFPNWDIFLKHKI